MMAARIVGDQFKIGRERRPYRTRSSFCLLAEYQDGGDQNKGKRWLDRIQSQGADGPRFFLENEIWFRDGGGKFFGNPKYTSLVKAFDWGSPPTRNVRLLPMLERSIERLVRDLEERNMIGEAVCIATVKTRTDHGYTEHGLNKMAQMFAGMFSDPRKSPLIFEAINEGDAHSTFTAEQLEFIAARWRRSEPDKPDHTNFPGSTIGLSAGGGFKPGFDDHGCTHVNLHFVRGKDWHLGEVVAIGNGKFEREPLEKTLEKLRLRAKGRPVASNETVHCWTKEERQALIADGINFDGLSTTSVKMVQEHWATIYDAGVSLCMHDKLGMEKVNPDAPLSPFEEAFKELFGNGVVVPPPPFVGYRYEPIIALAYEQILGRAPDSAGLIAYNEAMEDGMTEAELRESLIRSAEYETKNPAG